MGPKKSIGGREPQWSHPPMMVHPCTAPGSAHPANPALGVRLTRKRRLIAEFRPAILVPDGGATPGTTDGEAVTFGPVTA